MSIGPHLSMITAPHPFNICNIKRRPDQRIGIIWTVFTGCVTKYIDYLGTAPSSLCNPTPPGDVIFGPSLRDGPTMMSRQKSIFYKWYVCCVSHCHNVSFKSGNILAFCSYHFLINYVSNLLWIRVSNWVGICTHRQSLKNRYMCHFFDSDAKDT